MTLRQILLFLVLIVLSSQPIREGERCCNIGASSMRTDLLLPGQLPQLTRSSCGSGDKSTWHTVYCTLHTIQTEHCAHCLLLASRCLPAHVCYPPGGHCRGLGEGGYMVHHWEVLEENDKTSCHDMAMTRGTDMWLRTRTRRSLMWCSGDYTSVSVVPLCLGVKLCDIIDT